MGFRAEARAAAVSWLGGYAAQMGVEVKLQVYPGRPRSINPPTAFVDAMRETDLITGVSYPLRTVQADMIVLHGLFDSKEAVDQADAFVDGLIDYARTRYHEASGNSVVGIVSVDDDPTYVPDWLPPEQQRTYFATRIVLEGFGGT